MGKADILCDKGTNLDTHYPDFELGNEFLTAFGYPSTEGTGWPTFTWITAIKVEVICKLLV